LLLPERAVADDMCERATGHAVQVMPVVTAPSKPAPSGAAASDSAVPSGTGAANGAMEASGRMQPRQRRFYGSESSTDDEDEEESEVEEELDDEVMVVMTLMGNARASQAC
jgi:hypothetical protein